MWQSHLMGDDDDLLRLVDTYEALAIFQDGPPTNSSRKASARVGTTT